MGDCVIVAYRPKPGRDDEMLEAVAEHVPFLRRLGLATDRQPFVLRGKNGVIVEVFEWRDGAIASAHEHPEVLGLWARFE